MLVPCAPTTKVGAVEQTAASDGNAKIVWLQAAQTNDRWLLPGAATSMAPRPKFVYVAGASTLVHGPFTDAWEVGPVAATQMTAGVLQNVAYKSPMCWRSSAALPAETTMVTPWLRAKLNVLFRSPTKRPLCALAKKPPRLMFTTSAPCSAA